MELPWQCTHCKRENWVDMQDLAEWPLDRLVHAQGYQCEHCGMWEAISYTTTSMKEAERKLAAYKPTHRKYPFLLGKLVRKQIGVNERGEAYGKSRQPNMALT